VTHIYPTFTGKIKKLCVKPSHIFFLWMINVQILMTLKYNIHMSNNLKRFLLFYFNSKNTNRRNFKHSTFKQWHFQNIQTNFKLLIYIWNCSIYSCISLSHLLYGSTSWVYWSKSCSRRNAITVFSFARQNNTNLLNLFKKLQY